MEKEILDVIPENVEKEVNIEIETVNIDKGGTSNYVDLENKPSINDVELVGNKTLDELGIQPKGGYALSEDVNAQIDELQDQIPTSTSQLINDSDYTTNAYVNGLVGEINTVLASLTTITEVTNGDN